MDDARAKRMSQELISHDVGGWTLIDYINCGKSALVFKAKDSAGRLAAVKIFDPEIIDRYGDQKQLERINREKSLIGKSHPNLIEIFDGGVQKIADNQYFYVVMEYIDQQNLADVLSAIPVENVWNLIGDIASAAKFLEDEGLCHRDIKPENIVCSADGKQVKLLDLGVLRPLKGSNLTDEGRLPFIGTLQYTSPEYLLRQEGKDPSAWRALTFYQLGAVLHDLIMRVPLFQDFSEPFAKLSNAVQHHVPLITSSAVPIGLVALANNCLSKDPSVRLQTVKWSDFKPSLDVKDELTELKKRLAKRRITAAAQMIEPSLRAEQRAERLTEFARQLRELLRSECLEGSLPRQIFEEPETLESGSVRVTVQFDRSDEELLFVNFSSQFDISWLNDQDDAICIRSFAVVSKYKMKAPDAIRGNALYKGSFLTETLSKVVQAFLYAVAEQALNRADPSIQWEHPEDWFLIDVSVIKGLVDVPEDES